MKYVKLNDVCEINIGKTPSRYNSSYWDNGEYHWISIADMKKKDIGETKEKISSIAVKECNMKVIPKDTLIMSFKLSLGKLSITKEDMYSNEAIANFPIIEKTKLYINYLYYALQTLNVSKSSDRAVMGATLNKAKLNEIQIPLPPLDIQNKIADTLDKAQELIDKRKEQISALDKFLENLFLDMFGDPVSNPMGWEVETVNEICLKIMGGGTPSTKNQEYFSGNIPWVTPKDMKKLYINDSIDHISIEAVQNSSANIIPKGALLMVIRSGILKRKLPLAINLEEVTVNQDMKAFIVNNDKVSIYYLLYFFISIEYYLLTKVRGVTADNIEFKEIKDLTVPLPPLDLQNQFASIVEKVEAEKTKLEASLKEMEDNFNSIMQRAFKGELF